jgi:TetR/AcrR family transcriptional regulator
MNRANHRISGRALRRPPARAKESRAAILAAAGSVFARAGLAGARTDTIAADAGVNKALLYYYFKSKEDLYEAVVEDQFREFNRRALEILNGPGSAREVLLKYVNMHLDFISERHQSAPLFQQIMMSGGNFLERLIRRYFMARAQAVDRLLERGIRAGEFRKVDRFNAAISIVSLIVFYFSAARVIKLMGPGNAYSPANLKRRKQEVLDFIRHGLFTDSKIPS